MLASAPIMLQFCIVSMHGNLSKLLLEHGLRKIYHCTFRPKYFLDDFFHFLYPKSCEKFSFHPSKFLMTFFSHRPKIINNSIYAIIQETFHHITTTTPYLTYHLISKFDHISAYMRDVLHWLPLRQRIEFRVSV